MKNHVTLRDIASRVGLSVSTVSLALRNEGTVSKKTCHHVQEVAKEMGYLANPMLAMLASQRFRGGGRVKPTSFVYLTQSVPNSEGTLPSKIHYSGFEMEGRSLGYHVRHQHLSDPRSARQVGDSFYRSGVAGLAFGLNTFQDDYPWDELGLDRFALVACGFHSLVGRVPLVKHDAFMAAQVAWKKVYDRGYRRIGAVLFSHAKPVPDDVLRFAAVTEACSAANLPFTVPIFKGGHDDREGVVAWFERYRPDAVIGFHRGVYYWIRDLVERSGAQCAFVDMQCGSVTDDFFAGVDERVHEIGVYAARLLDQAIRHHERGYVKDPPSMVINPMWHDGPSLPPAPVAASEAESRRASSLGID